MHATILRARSLESSGRSRNNFISQEHTTGSSACSASSDLAGETQSTCCPAMETKRPRASNTDIYKKCMPPLETWLFAQSARGTPGVSYHRKPRRSILGAECTSAECTGAALHTAATWRQEHTIAYSWPRCLRGTRQLRRIQLHIQQDAICTQKTRRVLGTPTDRQTESTIDAENNGNQWCTIEPRQSPCIRAWSREGASALTPHTKQGKRSSRQQQ